MNFEIVKSNIIYVEADAVVLPANPSLKEGNGVSEVIFKEAGRKKLSAVCDEIGHCDVGFATVTEGYNLESDYIIHAVVPRWIDGKHDEYGLLSSAYLSALKAADSLQCKSVAFPLLSSGNNGFDPELAFEIARESIDYYQPESLERVILVIYENRVAKLVEKAGYGYKEIFEGIAIEESKRRKRERGLKKGKDYINKVNKAVNACKEFLAKEGVQDIIKVGKEIAIMAAKVKSKG